MESTIKIMSDIQAYVNSVEKESSFFKIEKDFTGREFKIFPISNEDRTLYEEAVTLMGETLPRKDNYGNSFTVTFIRKSSDKKHIELIVPMK